jgi:hypothetical protein
MPLSHNGSPNNPQVGGSPDAKEQKLLKAVRKAERHQEKTNCDGFAVAAAIIKLSDYRDRRARNKHTWEDELERRRAAGLADDLSGCEVRADSSQTKPKTYQTDFAKDGLPPILANHLPMDNPHWVNWRWEWKVTKGKGDWSKPPIICGTLNHAYTNNPQTWGTYAAAVAGLANADGIGLCLPKAGIGAVDLDKCYDWETKTIAPWAQKIIDKAPAGIYCEVTVSGTGLRLIGRSSGASMLRKFGNLELYRDANKYITISGLAINVLDGELADIDPLLDELQAEGDAAKAEPSAKTRQQSRSDHLSGCSGDDLARLIEEGADWLLTEDPAHITWPIGDSGKPDTSDILNTLVWMLAHRRLTCDEIVARFEEHPDGIAAKFAERGSDGVRKQVEKIYGDWESQNGAAPVAEPQEAIDTWPVMAEAAYYGLAGDFVRMIEPHSEADHAGLLLTYLISFGSIVGRGPYYMVERTKHYTNLFGVLIGDTALGRKGTAADNSFEIYGLTDGHWVNQCVSSGLSTGEGVLLAVCDGVYKHDKKGNHIAVLEHVSDKRLLLDEREFSKVLTVLKRETNTPPCCATCGTAVNCCEP